MSRNSFETLDFYEEFEDDNFDIDDGINSYNEEIGGVIFYVNGKNRNACAELKNTICEISSKFGLDISEITLPKIYSILGGKINKLEYFTFEIRSQKKINCPVDELQYLNVYHLHFIECRIDKIIRNWDSETFKTHWGKFELYKVYF